jgi:P27 family predicted phage terminase small subunit
MRGRKPLPATTKRRRGTDRAHKRKAAHPLDWAPTITADLKTPPEYFSEAAKAEWARLIEELGPGGIVSSLDRGLLECFAAARGDFVESERNLRKDGAVITDRDGNVRRSPWCFVRARAIDVICRVGAELGLSPVSRVRLGERLGGRLPSFDPAAKVARAPGDPIDLSTCSLQEFLDLHPGAPKSPRRH